MDNEHNFSFRDIEELEETSSVKKANVFLSNGYVLLAVIQEAKFYHEGNDYSRPLYVLGRPTGVDRVQVKI